MAASVIYLTTILMLTLKPGEPKYSHINFQIDVVLNFNLKENFRQILVNYFSCKHYHGHFYLYKNLKKSK